MADSKESGKIKDVRSPMSGCTPPVKTPSIEFPGTGSLNAGSTGKGVPIKSPLDGKAGVK